MTIQFTLQQLTSNAGDTVTLPPATVTAIVGGNNAGKSQLLRDVAAVVTHRESNSVVLASIAVARSTVESEDDVAAWLDANASSSISRNGVPYWTPNVGGSPITARQLLDSWNQRERNGRPWMSNAAPFVLHATSAGSLSRYAAGAAPVGPENDGNTNPLGQVFRDGDLEAELNALARETFGEELLLDRVNSEFRLRVGAIDVEVPPFNHPTREYADAVLKLPALDLQGDGMRSFIGLALLVLARPPRILLIDEPEAFLHPGQARALGRWLGGAARERDLQVIIATHDRDLLLGLLDADAPANVVRVVREGNANRLAQLKPEQIEEVRADAVLRYSNVLQGLFHSQVVVCESDGDCRFFGAALDDLAQTTGQRALADDILFVPAGGKQRVATIARALARLQVRSRAIVDFDVFRERDQLRDIVEGVGASWLPQMNDDYVTMVRPIQSHGLWDSVKNQGSAAVPIGEPTIAARRLLDTLQEIGVHVVPVGEMEGFDRSQSLHGAPWVSHALERGVHQEQVVHGFVEALLSL